MDIHDFLAHLHSGEAVVGGSELHRVMHVVSQEALKLTSELNGHYHTPEEIRELFSLLIGKPVGFNLLQVIWQRILHIVLFLIGLHGKGY